MFHFSNEFPKDPTHNNVLCMSKVICILSILSVANWHFPSDSFLTGKLLPPKMTPNTCGFSTSELANIQTFRKSQDALKSSLFCSRDLPTPMSVSNKTVLNGKTLYLGLAWHTYSYLTLRCFMSTHTRLINVIFMHSARHKTTWVFWHCCFKSLQSSKVQWKYVLITRLKSLQTLKRPIQQLTETFPLAQPSLSDVIWGFHFPYVTFFFIVEHTSLAFSTSEQRTAQLLHVPSTASWPSPAVSFAADHSLGTKAPSLLVWTTSPYCP